MRNDPVNVQVLNVDEFIRNRGCMEVKSSFVMEPSTTTFHPEGLYSEQIFGLTTSKERLIRYGYIDLRTTIFQPQIYQALCKLKQLYKEIMDGKRLAVFDTSINDFVPSDEKDENADTGYAFFMEHYPLLDMQTNRSLSRNDRVELLEQYKGIAIIDKHLVAPAGVRDYRVGSDGRAETEEINKLYLSILALSRAIPEGYSQDPAYDFIRVSLQKKTLELYKYILNILVGPNGGKQGFIQKKWGARVVAFSGRNVISAADLSAKSIDDPTFHGMQETKIPLFQAAKEFSPAVVHQLNRLFFTYTIKADEEQVAVVEPKTNNLVYRVIPAKFRKMYATPEGLHDVIDLFEDEDIRDMPVTLVDEEGKSFYTHMVYDDGELFFIFRSMGTFKAMLAEEYHKEVKEEFIVPLNYSTMLYIATWIAVQDKYVTITRYPVTAEGSMYPSKVHLISTDPSRTVNLASEFSQMRISIPEFPIPNKTFIDSTIPHPSALQGLGGDFDGDMVNIHSIMTQEAVEECRSYLNSPAAFVTAEKKMIYGINTDLLNLVMYNLMRGA